MREVQSTSFFCFDDQENVPVNIFRQNTLIILYSDKI